MGDCRIRIVIAKDLLSSERQEEITQASAAETKGSKGNNVIMSETATTLSWIRIFSADTTVREVVAQGTPELWRLYTYSSSPSSLSSSSWKDLPFQLWDCTFHPPKDISDWPTDTFAEMTGPKSKTLQDAGCFPSGTWMALPRGVTPGQFNQANYEENDAQYNYLRQKHNPGEPSAAGGNLVVQFKDPALIISENNNSNKSSAMISGKPLPSQVIASVTQRFAEDDENEEAQAQQARVARLENQKQLQKQQHERALKLDRRIQQLEDQSSSSEGKQKKVSDQVRRMLVKSRATGDKRLKQQDRLYFECILDWTAGGGDVGCEEEPLPLLREFRYFSPQDTFGKIASSFSFGGRPPPMAATGNRNVEVLVKRKNVTRNSSSSNMEEYRRFPVAMRVYEAISEKFLTGDLDRLVIRWFTGTPSDGSPSILDGMQDKAPFIPVTSSNDVEMTDATPSSLEDTGTADHDRQPGVSSTCRIVDENMTDAIRAMDQETNKGKKTKKDTPASIKVRTMQIKSKAKGDAKRIPNLEDRFFLEIIQVEKGCAKASSGFHFFANNDTLERIVQGVTSSTNMIDWDFFVIHPQNDGEAMSYNKISDTSMVLADAAAKDILKPFGRLILRPK